jgi:hypothetical protein
MSHDGLARGAPDGRWCDPGRRLVNASRQPDCSIFTQVSRVEALQCHRMRP